MEGRLSSANWASAFPAHGVNKRVNVPTAIATTRTVNIGSRLTETAAAMPEAIAVAMPVGRDLNGRRRYQQVTFRELEDDSNRLAAGLQRMGMSVGARIVLMVRPSIDFIALAFALFKAGAVTVLIDPGMGRASLLRCLEEIRPDGFVALPLAHAIRTVFRRRFPTARWNVTVGRRWFWRGPTLHQLRNQGGDRIETAATRAEHPAAIIFTTGSTGPPKGVLYRHGNFDRQVDELRDHYGIQPGEIDLPGFPLFGLFNGAMGVTTVIPDMDPSRPARVDPARIVEGGHTSGLGPAAGREKDGKRRDCDQYSLQENSWFVPGR